jgi:hypothetical protein
MPAVSLDTSALVNTGRVYVRQVLTHPEYACGRWTEA